MLWTLLVQLGCMAWSVAFEGGDLASIGVHALTLAANNTGILAPVVLEAALGEQTCWWWMPLPPPAVLLPSQQYIHATCATSSAADE